MTVARRGRNKQQLKEVEEVYEAIELKKKVVEGVKRVLKGLETEHESRNEEEQNACDYIVWTIGEVLIERKEKNTPNLEGQEIEKIMEEKEEEIPEEICN